MTALITKEAPQPKSTGQHRFHALDAMRGVAAVLVVIYHMPTSLHKIAPNSYLVVDLFFVLSGFVIGYSYEQRLKTTMGLYAFTWIRVIRLYPLYLVGTLLGLLDAGLHALHMHDDSFPPQLLILSSAVFFLPNLFARYLSPVLYPLDGAAWSLLFEMVANIVYALLVRCKLASSPILLGTSLVSLALLIGTHSSMDVGWVFASFWPALARVGFSFFLGILLSRIYRKGLHPVLTGRAAGIAMLAMCACIGLCSMTSFPSQSARVLGYVAAALVFPCLVFVGAGCQVPASWQPACNFLGDISYPLYVIHSPALYFVVLAAYFKHPAFTMTFSICMLVGLVPVAWWLGKHFDLPSRRYLTARLQARAI